MTAPSLDDDSRDSTSRGSTSRHSTSRHSTSKDDISQDAVTRAQEALQTTLDDWMAVPGIHGAYVGLLTGDDNALTSEVGIVVLVDPDSWEAVRGALPRQVAGTTVQARSSRPAPEGG